MQKFILLLGLISLLSGCASTLQKAFHCSCADSPTPSQTEPVQPASAPAAKK